MMKIKLLYKKYEVILNNTFFVGVLQLFSFIAPLLTYPYLVKVLGMDLYGLVLTAQILVSYATIIIDFGSNHVSAKNISIFRNDNKKLSEILSAILSTRFYLWIFCFVVYGIVVLIVPDYRRYYVLFLLSYLLTLNDLLFPQFFFQGMENMKIISLLNILIKLIFILFVFLFVKEQSHYLLVPLLYAIGYTIAGLISLYIIKKEFNIGYVSTNYKIKKKYFLECLPILSTQLVCTIKDKFNYLLVGSFLSMSNVVVYDLGLKFINLIEKPSSILTTVLLPRFAKNKDLNKLKKVMLLVLIMSLLLVFLLNLFLEPIVQFFLHKEINVLPLRLFSIASVFLSVSTIISYNYFIGFGLAKYSFYSILVTTFAYLVLLVIILKIGVLKNLYSFIFLAVASYVVEFIYRIMVFYKHSKHSKR